MHSWGDKNVDWKGISDAARYIGTNLRKWGRVSVQDYKEKYGTVRVYCNFGWWQLHSITHPGYAYSQYPQWLWKLDCDYISKVVQLLNPLVTIYQVWLYKYLYRQAIRKWPLLREEILCGADYNELLTEHGLHRVRMGERSYAIHHDWHPDNWSTRYPAPVELEPEDEVVLPPEKLN